MTKIMDKLREINNKVALKVTLVMGSMWCAYTFFMMSMIPLINPGLQTIVFYVSGAVIQLVALPLIMVGQRLLNEGSEKRAEDDHTIILKEFEILKNLHQDHAEDLEKMNVIIANQQKLLDSLTPKSTPDEV